LQKISEKTEEIKSLRDGVSCHTCLHLSMQLTLRSPAFQRNVAAGSVQVDYHEPVHYRIHDHDRDISAAQFYRSTSSVYRFRAPY
jgi:hypothetical protein